jgi:hypothetical protein
MSSVSHLSPAEELAAFLARRPTPEEIATFRLSDSALERVRELIEKNKDGTLTLDESHELDRLVLLDDIIGLIQVHAVSPETGKNADNGEQPPQATGT